MNVIHWFLYIHNIFFVIYSLNNINNFYNNSDYRSLINTGVDLRRGNRASWSDNSYTPKIDTQSKEEAFKILKDVEPTNKHAKDVETTIDNLLSNQVSSGSIPYNAVDAAPKIKINNEKLLIPNDVEAIDSKIELITKALKEDKITNPNVKKILETQLEDLHSTKWLRSEYHKTMEEAGFKIPDEYKDMTMLTQNNKKMLFDSKGNLLGNITGVSKEHPYIGSTGLMPYLHGTTDIGKQTQMGKTLYRAIHHGLNNAHGIPLSTRGSFAPTTIIENGVPVTRYRAKDMWNSGVNKGWFEPNTNGGYKVIKKFGGEEDWEDELDEDEIEELRRGGYVVEDLD